MIGASIALTLAISVAGLLVIRSYDKATRIDRSVAKVVVRQYVNAALVDRDEKRSALYLCDNRRELAAVANLRKDLEDREIRYGYATKIEISRSVESHGGSVVDIEMQLNQGAGTDVRTRIVDFRFYLVERDGWRVCSAEQLPDPTPTATPPTAG